MSKRFGRNQKRALRGKIDFAYELQLIDYTERDQLMAAMIAACARRRDELHRAKLARLGIKE